MPLPNASPRSLQSQCYQVCKLQEYPPVSQFANCTDCIDSVITERVDRNPSSVSIPRRSEKRDAADRQLALALFSHDDRQARHRVTLKFTRGRSRQRYRMHWSPTWSRCLHRAETCWRYHALSSFPRFRPARSSTFKRAELFPSRDEEKPFPSLSLSLFLSVTSRAANDRIVRPAPVQSCLDAPPNECRPDHRD